MNKTIQEFIKTMQREVELDEDVLHNQEWNNSNYELLKNTIQRLEEEKHAILYAKMFLRGLI